MAHQMAHSPFYPAPTLAPALPCPHLLLPYFTLVQPSHSQLLSVWVGGMPF